ncbi:MAG: AAA family ATPase [bacterium]|nr:AAA family ATPase [bacterium]
MTKQEESNTKVLFKIGSLGPIRDSVIELKPFMLFSGESNTGKSYTAIMVYYLFYMLNNEKIGTQLAKRLFDKKKISRALTTDGKATLPLPRQLAEEWARLYNKNINSFIAYMLGYEDYSCDVKLQLGFSPGMSEQTQIILELIEVSPDVFDLKIKMEMPDGRYESNGGISFKKQDMTPALDDRLNRFVLTVYKYLFCDSAIFHSFFLPPARGAFSSLGPSTWKDFLGIGMYKEFMEGMDRVRFRGFDIEEEEGEQKNFIIPLVTELLNGIIEIEREQVVYVVRDTDTRIPISAGSSSVKELFSLYLLLKRVDIDSLSVCIEEPEAHLHPNLQRSAALLLAYIVNQGGFLQVTTHSDFLMNQMNNLVKLHFIRQEKTPEEFAFVLQEAGIREDFVLNPDMIGAYYFESVGSAVHVRKLEISRAGMPLESFKSAYDRSVNETRCLREALDEDD